MYPNNRQKDRYGQQQYRHEFGPHDAQIEHRDIDVRTVIVAIRIQVVYVRTVQAARLLMGIRVHMQTAHLQAKHGDAGEGNDGYGGESH